MKLLLRFSLIGLLVVATVVLAAIWLRHASLPVLNPKGVIALHERNLIMIAALLSIVVVVPVFVLMILFAWRYRAGNHRAIYTPDWDHNRRLEAIWWLIPSVLILVLAVITWRSTRELDPYRPLASAQKAVTIQVVALQWKWLFIYPDEKIATVNYVEFPVDTPIHFELTSDAPMNSFWIPQLAGQIYAMSGMSTQLNLMATSAGDYRGSSANLSGSGFAGMTFTARATSAADYARWVTSSQASPQQLTMTQYNLLSKPSTSVLPETYSLPSSNLYDTILAKVNSHAQTLPHEHAEEIEE